MPLSKMNTYAYDTVKKLICQKNLEKIYLDFLLTRLELKYVFIGK